MSTAKQLIDLVLKNGLKRYKVLNSRHSSITHVEDDNKKGVVFGFRNKENMTNARGFVMSSIESVYENIGELSHWTPNIFSWGGYADENRQTVKGHSEKNLIQINAFVLDIDGASKSKYELDYLIMQCCDNSDMIPTAILETPGGYHLYFVLNTASYISSANNYKSLRVAKVISSNLRASFLEFFPKLDISCNHFGIFRMPSEENILHFDEKYVYDFEDMMEWSMAYVKEQQSAIRLTMTLPGKNKTKEIGRHIDATWYKNLLNTSTIKGGKGQIGRNNTLFTAALANYASGVSQEDCYNEIDLFNSNLDQPLRNNEVMRAVKNAYSGKYLGPHAEFIEELTALYTGKTTISKKGYRVGSQYWTKHAKKREDRERSHYAEWKQDLIKYINANTTIYRPYYQVTREEICKKIGIPLSSLKDLLRELRKTGAIYIQTKRGKGGYTKLATKKKCPTRCFSKKNTYLHTTKAF